MVYQKNNRDRVIIHSRIKKFPESFSRYMQCDRRWTFCCAAAIRTTPSEGISVKGWEGNAPSPLFSCTEWFLCVFKLILPNFFENYSKHSDSRTKRNQDDKRWWLISPKHIQTIWWLNLVFSLRPHKTSVSHSKCYPKVLIVPNELRNKRRNSAQLGSRVSFSACSPIWLYVKIRQTWLVVVLLERTAVLKFLTSLNCSVKQLC